MNHKKIIKWMGGKKREEKKRCYKMYAAKNPRKKKSINDINGSLTAKVLLGLTAVWTAWPHVMRAELRKVNLVSLISLRKSVMVVTAAQNGLPS